MLDLPRKGIIGELLDVNIAKCFDTDEAKEGLSKRVLPLNCFMPSIVTFAEQKEDKVMEHKRYSTVVASKRPGSTKLTFEGKRELPPGRSVLGSEMIPCIKQSKWSLIQSHSTQKRQVGKRHSFFQIHLKIRYHIRSRVRRRRAINA